MATNAKPRFLGESYSLPIFFVLAYALMWACFFAVAFAVSAKTAAGYSLLLLGAFAPGIAALFLSARADGSAGVRALLQPILKWHVGVRWYLFAVAYIATIKLVAAVLYRIARGGWPRFGTEQPIVILAAIVFSTPFQAGEEVGWRGYALPRLVKRFGLRCASLLLGVIWAFWHIPQFFIREADTYGQSFFLYVAQVIALSVAIAWLWARTNGSLLLPMLFHSAVNNSKDIVPSAIPGVTNSLSLHASLVGWLTVALLWICAAYFLAKMPSVTSNSRNNSVLRGELA